MAELDVVPAVDEPSEETFFDEPPAPSVEEPVEEPPEEPPVEAPAPKAKAKAKAKPRAKPRAVPKATPPANTPEPVAPPHIPSHFDLLPTIDSHLRTWLAAQKSAERQRLADRYAQFRLI